MLVLGIDPGSRVTGWGIVERERGRYRLVASGAIRNATTVPLAQRLLVIHRELEQVIATWAPEVMAVEAIFRHKSSESALRLGHARGVPLLAAAEAGLPVFEYNSAHIKKAVTGFGGAQKTQVARMVSLLLGETIDAPADVTDALAVAITHHAHSRTAAAVQESRR
jgi:crossover junction endodeoxyribonuclease RuvC